MLPATTITSLRRTLTPLIIQATLPWTAMFPPPPHLPGTVITQPPRDSNSRWRMPCSLPIVAHQGRQSLHSDSQGIERSMHRKWVTNFRVPAMLLILTVITPHTYWHAPPPHSLPPSSAPAIRYQTEPEKQQSVRPRSLIFPFIKRELSEDKPPANLFIAHDPALKRDYEMLPIITLAVLFFSSIM